MRGEGGGRPLTPAAPCAAEGCGEVTIPQSLWLRIPVEHRALLANQGIAGRLVRGMSQACSRAEARGGSRSRRPAVAAQQCKSCPTYLVRGQRPWRTLTIQLWESLRAVGVNAHRGRGLCYNCYRRINDAGDLIDFERIQRRREEVLEEFDLIVGEFPEDSMAKQIIRAAPRLGMTVKALERAIYRARRDQRTSTDTHQQEAS